MNSYRMNSMMVGVLYLFGSIFGVASAFIGGEVISSMVQSKSLSGIMLLDLVVTDSSRILSGSLLILLMGISLVAMTFFLYPIIKKDSEELAMGMLLFRGAMEGTWYFLTTIRFLALIPLGKEYISTGANSLPLQSIGNVIYNFQNFLGPIGTIMFAIGATCIYLSFYRTRLIPRWMSVWGLIGLLPYLAYALLHLFGMNYGFEVYLQIPLGIQEMVMALWLIIKGFNHVAIENLMTKNEGNINLT